jgi:YVTN family beta-propeller protein
MTDSRHLLPLLLLVGAALRPCAAGAAPFAYIANRTLDAVTVIDTATDTISGTIPLAPGTQPEGVAITPDGRHVYIGSVNTFSVTVADTATNTVTPRWRVRQHDRSRDEAGWQQGLRRGRVEHDQDRRHRNQHARRLHLLQRRRTIQFPQRVAFNPSGTRAYVANAPFTNMAVVDTTGTRR